MVGKDWARVSLARLSVHGTRHASEETVGQRRQGDQPIGQDCSDTRHRLQSGQKSRGQVGRGQEDDQGHRHPPGKVHPHRIHRQEHHASQTKIASVILFFLLCDE